MIEFLAMGGYAAFVWPAWGAGAVIMIFVTFHGFYRERRVRARLAAYGETENNRGSATENKTDTETENKTDAETENKTDG